MKKILCATVALLTVSSLIAQDEKQSGAIFHIGAATSTKSKLMVDGGGGYMYKNMIVEGSIIAAPLDQREATAAYFNVSIGYMINLNQTWSVSPLLGPSYVMKSVDKKSLNSMAFSAGIRIKFKDIYLGVNTIDNTAIVSIGLGGIIGE